MKFSKPTIPALIGLAVLISGPTTNGQEARDELRYTSGLLEAMLAEQPPSVPDPRVADDKPDATATFSLTTVPTVSSVVTPEGATMETVAERYANGNVKIERQVILDSEANYVNHGKYTMYAPDGGLRMAGAFEFGKQQGRWVQHFTEDKGHIISAEQQREFTGPFVSEATFVDGKLDGIWTIRDAGGQNIIEWSFANGVRNGNWTWWHSNGQKWLDATFFNGSLNGQMMEWDRNGEVVAQHTYIDGRYLAKEVGWYALGHKHFEGMFLRVPAMPDPVYDWWNGSAAAKDEVPTGEDQKHGTWVSWYRNGNKKTEGTYDHGVLTGKFTWWYENGQKKAEGEYVAGKNSGTWTTWHPNGLRESQVTYVDGDPIGTWMKWDTQGKLADMRDFGLESKNAQKTSTQRRSSTTRGRYQRTPTTPNRTSGQRPSTASSRPTQTPTTRANTTQLPSSGIGSR